MKKTEDIPTFIDAVDFAEHGDKVGAKSPDEFRYYEEDADFGVVTSSRLHNLAGAIVKRRNEDGELVDSLFNPSSFNGAGVFAICKAWHRLIDVNWTEAIKDYKNPFDKTIYEFRIDGRNFIVSLIDNTKYNDGSTGFCFDLFFEFDSNSWVRMRHNRFDVALEKERELSSGKRNFIVQIIQNILAVNILLDSEVAVKSIVRAPIKLNQRRQKLGRAPLADYHVIDLCKSLRVESAPGGMIDDRNGPRLHFRRGHWRHFDNGKTWVRWTLVGDPRLGFVEKAYRA